MTGKGLSSDQERRAIEQRRARGTGGKFRIQRISGALPSWSVEGESGQSYRVTVPAFPVREGAQCSCRDFMARGLGTCKHLEAVLAHAALEPPEPPSPSKGGSVDWPQVQAAHARTLQEGIAQGESPERLARRLRREGRTLTAR